MKQLKWMALASMFAACGVKKPTATTNEREQVKIQYPITMKGDVVHSYFNQTVADPYHWLEDDRSPETAQWVKDQNQTTFGYLEQIPYRQKIVDRLTTLWNYERTSAPFKAGNFEYYYKNDGLQNQSVVYRRDSQGKEELFLDPNSFSNDGSSSLDGLYFSKDGTYCAYLISIAGSDWGTIYVMNATAKETLVDVIKDVKFSTVSFYKGIGFYYSTYEKPEGSQFSAKTDHHKVYFHKLGTQQKEDKLIFGAKEKYRYTGAYVTDNQRFLILSGANETSTNNLYYMEIGEDVVKPITLGMEGDHYVMDAIDEDFYILTNYQAPNRRLIKVNREHVLDKSRWLDVISQKEEVMSVTLGAGYIFAQFLRDASTVVEQYDLQGTYIRSINLPGIGTASGFGGRKSDTKLYYSFTNYYTPASIYALDPKTGESTLYSAPKVDFESSQYESKQVFYTSKDGTNVPMIITYKKGLKLDGTNPTILHGYGGFNISLTPAFSVTYAVWMEMGGIYAVPNLRGGGEYGKKWHDAGVQMKKQNVFDDFIAAAEYLIKSGYTSKEKLAISGRSNGGLLVGATMTQRPDLFRVALPSVGVMDMLRYHTFTSGAGWKYDYGTSDDSMEMFNYLRGYSPVHNVKAGVHYPATLVTTGDHDDRVVPAHSFKFAAELQDKQVGNNPVLIRIDVNAGHGAGKPVSKVIQEFADIFSFTLYNMDINQLGDSK